MVADISARRPVSNLTTSYVVFCLVIPIAPLWLGLPTTNASVSRQVLFDPTQRAPTISIIEQRVPSTLRTAVAGAISIFAAQFCENVALPNTAPPFKPI
jgi:ornithine cyclodeaminase/alanine dehydrogenase-like protein (mu-crystallin family)